MGGKTSWRDWLVLLSEDLVWSSCFLFREWRTDDWIHVCLKSISANLASGFASITWHWLQPASRQYTVNKYYKHIRPQKSATRWPFSIQQNRCNLPKIHRSSVWQRCTLKKKKKTPAASSYARAERVSVTRGLMIITKKITGKLMTVAHYYTGRHQQYYCYYPQGPRHSYHHYITTTTTTKKKLQKIHDHHHHCH